jgi:hypothetical protein
MAVLSYMTTDLGPCGSPITLCRQKPAKCQMHRDQLEVGERMATRYRNTPDTGA